MYNANKFNVWTDDGMHRCSRTGTKHTKKKWMRNIFQANFQPWIHVNSSLVGARFRLTKMCLCAKKEVSAKHLYLMNMSEYIYTRRRKPTLLCFCVVTQQSKGYSDGKNDGKKRTKFMKINWMVGEECAIL